jgi:hypothetical protein
MGLVAFNGITGKARRFHLLGFSFLRHVIYEILMTKRSSASRGASKKLCAA